MKSKPPTMPCPHCHGSGRIEVTGIYAQTLKDVQRWCSRSGRYVVANRDAGWFGCNGTALSNRLAVLEKHGLVYSVKYGRQRRFYPCD